MSSCRLFWVKAVFPDQRARLRAQADAADHTLFNRKDNFIAILRRITNATITIFTTLDQRI
jgi:hypothetical protein